MDPDQRNIYVLTYNNNRHYGRIRSKLDQNIVSGLCVKLISSSNNKIQLIVFIKVILIRLDKSAQVFLANSLFKRYQLFGLNGNDSYQMAQWLLAVVCCQCN